MQVRWIVFFAVPLAAAAADRAQLSGVWQQQDGNVSWVIQDKGDALHLQRRASEQTVIEFDCNTVGKECDAKESGHAAKVTLWYNGPKLVEMETRGKEVIKRRFTVLDEAGQTMQVEIMPLVPAGKSEVLKFKRVPTVP